jgi:phytoene synthase
VTPAAVTPDEYCRERTAKSGSSFYYSFLFLPEARRRAIIALYAFCREVDDVVDEVSDPEVARVKLAWWRREVASAFEGTPQHPVAQALAPVVRDFGLPSEHSQTIIDGMAMDLDQARYLDFPALELYCHRVAGVVGLLSAEIFGVTDPSTREYARDLGVAFQLTNVIRDVGEDALRGRIYLPQDELAQFRVPASEILRRKLEPASRERFRALMEHQVARARSWYDRAFAKLPQADRRAQRTGIIMASIYRALLDEIARDGFQVLDRRVSLTPVRKFGIAWLTALRG